MEAGREVSAQPACASAWIGGVIIPTYRHIAVLPDIVAKVRAASNWISVGMSLRIVRSGRGTLVPGQRADLLVMDRETRKVRAVFVNGRKVLARD